MAQSQKGTPSASDPKEKKSLFGDEEIGKEFLGSWKSLSLAEDDTLDFSFDNASTGKKKSFTFGKLDINFNLDGDFSSFKVGMPDLDFSSPAKNSEKPKEKAGRETSSGNHRGKRDSFSFSFDFDDLDSFKLDSSLTKAENTSAKKLYNKEVSSDGSEDQGSKLKLNGCADLFEGRQSEKFPASERAMTSMVEGVTSDSGNENSLHDKSPSSSGTSGELAVSCGERTFPDKTVTDGAEKTHKQSHILEKAIPTEPDAVQHKQILPVQSLVGNNSTEDTVLDMQPESGFLDMKATMGCGGSRRVDSQVTSGIGSDHANSDQRRLHVTQESENSYSQVPTDRTNENEPLPGDLDLEATSAETLSEPAPHDCKVNMNTQISALKTLSPSRSAPLADKEALMNEKESAIVCPKLFNRSERAKPQLQQPSSTVEKVSSSRSKGNSSMHEAHPSNRNAYVATDSEIGRKSDVNHENSEPKGHASQSPMHVTESESIRDESERTDAKIPAGRIIETELLPQDLDLEATSAEILSHDCKFNKDTQTSALRPVAQLRSMLVADKVTPTKEKETGFLSSKFPKRLLGTNPKLCQASPTGGEVSSYGSKGITSMHLVHPDNQKREGFIGTNAQIGKKMNVDSKALSRGLMKGQPGFSGGEMVVKNLRSVGEGENGVSLQDGCKLAVNRRSPDKEVTKGNPALAGSKMHFEDLKHLSRKVDPACSIEKATMSMVKENVTSSSMGSTRNSKMLTVEGVKAGKSPDVSILKISRPLGAIKDQPNATFQRKSHSLRNLENNMEIQRNISSKLVHPIANTERETSLVTSLKRKASEESNAGPMSLNPHKRYSPSPSKNSVKEPLESMVEEQVYHNDMLALSKPKNVLRDNPNSEIEMARLVNLDEQDIHLVMENDNTVEKAEAYAKELEHICTMLKKKNEEAKEILVRAIVNNNRLLMLNHPMFDEKIRMVERFAEQLTLN